MPKSELVQIIANGENSGVEFKRDDCHPERLAGEIVAMLNLNGGMVLLGVEDDGAISGVGHKDLEELGYGYGSFQENPHRAGHLFGYLEVISPGTL